MKKRIVSVLLCLCMVVGMLSAITTKAQAVSLGVGDWSNGWEWWSQNQSSKSLMIKYGCFVVAKAKMLVSAGIASNNPSEFNPDIYLDWEQNNGYTQAGLLANYPPNGPEEYARRLGKSFVYEGEYKANVITKIWENINAGKHTILSNGNAHYVYVNNGASIETGRIRIYESWNGTSTNIPGTVDLNFTPSAVLTYSGGYFPAPSIPAANPLNIGSDFYATIYYPKGGKLLEARDSGSSGYPVNVQLNDQYYASTDSSDPRCIWRFIRHGDDGSYKIINEYYGYCLDVETGVAGPGRNVGAWREDHNGNPERWIVCEAPGSDGRWYNLVTALDKGYTMDVHGGYTSGGTNVQLYYRQDGNDAQQFNIVKQNGYWRPYAPSVPSNVRVAPASDRTVISWDAVPTQNSCDSRAYDVRIRNADTARIIASDQVTGTSYTYRGSLASGSWIAEVRAVNTKYPSTSSNYASAYASKQFAGYSAYTLTLTASPAEGGTVSGGGQYEYGDYTTILAAANDGYHFVRWEWADGSWNESRMVGVYMVEDLNITAVFEKDQPDEPDTPDTPDGSAIRITRTNIKADGVFNNEGYGSLVIDGDFGTDDEGEYVIYAPAQIALIDRKGTFLFPYREDPVGDGGYDTARFRYSDGIVSLTLGHPYISGGGIPQYYRLDGSMAFPLETTDREYTDENGVKYHDWTSWTGGPMCDGYAAVIQKLYSSWTNGWAGGSSGDGDNRTLIIDKNGTVTCELPEEYNETTSGGGANLWYFDTQMSLGWCGEGLFAFYDHTIDYDDWSSTTEVLGYMDPTGKTVIDLAGRGYINAWPFSEGLAAVKNQDEKIGFIDKTGALVIPCIYTGADSFTSSGLCAVQKDGKCGYIDREGNVVIPFAYDNAFEAHNGLAAVMNDGKYGLIDYTNNIVVPIEYDDISSYDNGVAYGIKDGVVYLITDYDPDAPDVPDIPEKTYVITFDANGGTADAPFMTTGPDGRLPSLPRAARSGYVFDGWYTSDGQPVSTSTVFGADTVVYARWTYIDYPPSVDPWTPPASDTAKPESPTPKPQEPDQPAAPVQPEEPASQPSEELWRNPYADTEADAWYYDAVRFVSENGLMNGVSGDRFAPGEKLSRAQLAQILYNKEGKPAVSEGSAFADVAADAWYADAVIWAASRNIAGGYGDGTFGPNDAITREQLAVMLWRYAGSPAPAGGALAFRDAGAVSAYALEALRWAAECGIINGKDGNYLDPQGPATRAQTAQMLKNYLE